MNELNIKATFSNSDRVIKFSLSQIISMMGSNTAGEWSIEDQIGEEMAFLQDNYKTTKFEITS